MGRLDAIVNDGIEQKFRMEAIKRFGAKKGNLSKALEEAMEIWLRSDVVSKLKAKILSPIIPPQEEFENLVDGLKRQGKAAMPALLEVLDHPLLTPDQSRYVTKVIRDVPVYPS